MARRRRQRREPRRLWVIGSLVTLGGIWGYAQFISPVLEGSDETPVSETSVASAGNTATSVEVPADRPRLTSSRPETPSPRVNTRVSEKGARDRATTSQNVNPELLQRATQLLSAGMQALDRGDWVVARSHLSEAVSLGIDGDKLVEARAALVRIGTQTVFSGAALPEDPLVKRHVVSPGESLGKIAKQYSVSADFLAAINQLSNKNVIRVGQNLTVVQGPFHARVDKASYRMDIYLQDTFVRQYQVGLGANDSTPTGEWVVGTMLQNPTYYPPRGGKVVAADDPQNPIGEHWIELIGVGGKARNQQRYGIHGTIEPDSIGRSESLGCIRMHNEDVAEVFMLLTSKKSHVYVR